MICALAGRRIDAADAETRRFPLEQVGAVRERIRRFLETGVSTLVCSAACGADLIALEVAGMLGIRRRVALPFAREQFRETSVVDRPGDWGPAFDRILDELESTSDVVVLQFAPKDPRAYAGANAAILGEAERISRELAQPIHGILVWDGKPRGEEDLTAALLDEIKHRGYPVTEIPTL